MTSIDDIYARMDRDGKAAPTTSTAQFLGTVLVGVPVWLGVVLPLTIVSQVGRALIKPLKSKPEFCIDTGTKVDASEIIPRDKRKYDVVILGATGFTGKLAVEHIAKTYGVGDKVKWAIAGRSKTKLEQVKKDVAAQVGNDKVLTVDALIVDTSVVSNLLTLVKDTRAVITTAGPFQKYGSNVVEFCAKYGTHYVDITGETMWVKAMMLQWESTAQKTGAKIVSMCGNDCVPWDLTVMKLEEALPDGEELERVDCLDDILAEASGGTMASVLMIIDGSGMPPPDSPDNPFLQLPDGTKSEASFKFEPPLLVRKSTPINGRLASTYSAFSALSTVNAEVVQRSLLLRKRSMNVIYRESQVAPDFKTAFGIQFGTLAFVTSLFNPVTLYLLKKFAFPKPGEGPSRENMEKKFYLMVSAQGTGTKGTKVQSTMYFPRDPGYMDTARMVAESGLTLALESSKLSPEGGFFTPSTGMGNVLLDRLCRTGTYFALKVTK